MKNSFLIYTVTSILIATGSLYADASAATDALSANATSAATPEPVPLPPIPATFRHPGLLNSLEELHFIKHQIDAGKEPWKTAFEQMKATKYADLNYKPHPHETVSSGFLGAGGVQGGTADESDDAIAAYAQVLMWIFTGDEHYAENAVAILNGWSILQHCEGGNWYLQASWEGSIFPEAAELLRATYPKWSAEDIAKFSTMLDRAFLPLFHNQMAYGNRELSVCNAMVAIGVFTNDRAAFAEGMAHWISYVPCWIYLTEDGPKPRKPDYWLTSPSNDELAKLDAGLFPDVKQSWIYADISAYRKENHLGDDHSAFEQMDMDKLWNNAPEGTYVDGLCAETFRDLGHCDLGYAQMINTAEIAWHQGIDLYAMDAKRITSFMELQSFLRIGDPIPKAFYSIQASGIAPTYEIGYNHYHNRIGVDLPKTQAFIEQVLRPCLAKTPNISKGWCWMAVGPGVRSNQINYPAVLDMAWEALTHAELGGTKTPPAK